MSADPIPDSPVLPDDGKGAILQANTRRIDLIFALKLLEVQTGVSGIVLKSAVSSLRIFLNVRRETLE
jgi:hypothetical protein